VARELKAFREQAAFFGVDLTLEADLSFLGQIGGSSLTDTHLAVPPSAGEAPGIPSTYVPFRNSLLLAVAVAWAEVLGAAAVFIGANILDNPGYPDCRPEYFEAFNRVIALGTRPETRIDIKTPIIHLDKAGIVRLGLELGVPPSSSPGRATSTTTGPAGSVLPASCASKALPPPGPWTPSPTGRRQPTDPASLIIWLTIAYLWLPFR
jgi:queuosine biosynthesis protein QueC